MYFTDHTAVDIEPPVTNEVLLVVERPVGAEQGGDGGGAGGCATDVVGLTVRVLGGSYNKQLEDRHAWKLLGGPDCCSLSPITGLVSIVSRHQPGAVEGSWRGAGVDRVVLAGAARHRALCIPPLSPQ